MPYKKRGWIEVDYNTKMLLGCINEVVFDKDSWDSYLNVIINELFEVFDQQTKEKIINCYKEMVKT